MRAAAFVAVISAFVMIAALIYQQHNRQPWDDTGFRPELIRIPEPEASAYYDDRKLINDNQRAYIDRLAEEARAKQ